MLKGGLTSVENIDTAMELACGYPMGPFQVLDLGGIDTVYFAMDYIYENTKNS